MLEYECLAILYSARRTFELKYVNVCNWVSSIVLLSASLRKRHDV